MSETLTIPITRNMITVVIPGCDYRPEQTVVIPSLTDTEKEALSFAFLDRPWEVVKYEDMAGKDGIISGWHPVPDAWEAARAAAIKEAMLSLTRFGLVEQRYEHPNYQSRPEKGTPEWEKEKGIIRKETKDGHTYYWVRDQYHYRYSLTDAGKEVQASCRAHWYKCCDACVRLMCVCRERTFCAEHGGGCHGSHD